jgi:DNA-directed RNA polymerase subunit RPC12/RpoP
MNETTNDTKIRCPYCGAALASRMFVRIRESLIAEHIRHGECPKAS